MSPLAWLLFDLLASFSILGVAIGFSVWAVTSRVIARQDAMEAYFKEELEKLKHR